MADTPYSENWIKRVQPFADAVGKNLGEVIDALSTEVGEPNDQALEALSSEEYTPFEALKTALVGLKIPPAILRKNINLLRGKKAVSEEAAAASMIRMTGVLPPVPDDKSFVESLKVGGELKVGAVEVIAAVKAALASKVGFFEIPDVLKQKMESYAESLEEPCGTEYFEIRKLVTKRNYADIMHALGIEGTFVTDQRKAAFMGKLEALLWDEVGSFHRQLMGWNKSWMETSNNPTVLVSTITSALGGGGAMPTLMQPPDTAFLRDAAEKTIITINKVFAGVGIPIARALAYDAEKIKEVLDNSRIPTLIGAPNKDQMLKMLGVNVAGDYVRLERNLVQYIVAIMEYPKLEAGQNEIMYLSAMLQLGLSIDWDKLLSKAKGLTEVSLKPHSRF